MKRLTPTALRSGLGGLPQWKRSGKTIVRTFQFADFGEAMRFVNAVARRAERARHHPDIDIRWNQVFLALTSHEAGGLTDADLRLAAAIDRLPTIPRKPATR